MGENKVELTLEKYIEMYEKVKETENKLNQVCSLILNYTELDSKKGKLIIDGYDMKYGRMLDLVKEIMPKEYEIRFQELLKEEE